ncbi:MAG TPA: kelch repeat-containing protein [Terriglobia bacterium]|nr:kelch repeat-containing protein [Terriglobia bacterium]
MKRQLWNAMDCEAARLEIKIGKNHCVWSAVLVGMLLTGTLYAQLSANTWTLLRQDPAGARRGSALRYAPKAGAFVLWGFMNDDPDLLQEQPLMHIPEYDVVAFDLVAKQWQSQFPAEWAAAWKKQLPLAYVPRTYSGITTGSERTVLRAPTEDREGVPRPDLNIVFDQVVYYPPTESLIYFTGGLTAAYHVQQRRWTDLRPAQSPPPVLAGSLAYDPLHDEIVLVGGGHVAEQRQDGRIVGHSGTWLYRFQENRWLPLALETEPPPRMNTRMVCDTKNQQLVLFGGDAQSHYLADTWIFDLKTRAWRPSKAASGPEARAGHFTVYDPETGWVIIGGGYNQKDLTDMWAFDAAADRWMALQGEVPTGFYLSADLAPEKRVILLAANTQKPGDTMSCNILYPVRSTYGYRIESKGILKPGVTGRTLQSIPKGEVIAAESQDTLARRSAVQRQTLETLPVNEWVHLTNPGRVAPTRTWGSATFDPDREQILYWGGGHCGYEGNDVDAYSVPNHTWRRLSQVAEYPERLWNHGVRLAGVTFAGGPWTEHGRSIYAYDPVSHKLIMVRTIRLTTGYDPEALRRFPMALTSDYQSRVDALVSPPSSYVKYATWTFDPDAGRFELLGAAPEGLDTLLSTPHGVIGLNVNWPRRLNDAGYHLPPASQPPEDTVLSLFDAKARRWQRLGEKQASPQNLYERTSLAYDSNRDRVLLHGGGANRDELWSFELKEKRWKNLTPTVITPQGAKPPASGREAVFLAKQDLLLIYAASSKEPRAWTLWAYRPSQNVWEELEVSGKDIPRRMGWNDALVHDAKRDLIFLVAGASEGKASVYALRFNDR